MSTTKHIKIFLASSSELVTDRKEFEIFINRKNKDLSVKGLFIDLVIWEDFLDAMSQNRLQNEYNKSIRECDIFVMLLFTKVGKYTEEEFETAFGQFKDTNRPLIYTYFKDAEVSVGSINEEDIISLFNFKRKLKDLGHFYTVYKNIDDLKYQFDRQLDKCLKDGARKEEVQQETLWFWKDKGIELSRTQGKVGTGWIRSTPDTRDFEESHPEIQAMTKKLGIVDKKNVRKSLPASMDLRRWFLGARHQGMLNSSSAQAVTAIVEYYQNRAFGMYFNLSSLFVYKNAKNFSKVNGNAEVSLKSCLVAIILCGAPPEEDWPYTDEAPAFDTYPPSYVYSIAHNFEAMWFFCHDLTHSGRKPATVLRRVKAFIAAGIPSAFGFYLYPSFNNSDIKGGIPYCCPGEKAQAGHAVAAVGYDDSIQITNRFCKKKTTGALLIRNSWGSEWGNDGYGWLPYEYVLKEQALDFWSILSFEWIATRQFGF